MQSTTTTETTITEKTRFSFEAYKIAAVFIATISICLSMFGVYRDFKETFSLFQQKTELQMRDMEKRMERQEIEIRELRSKVDNK